MSTEKNKGGEEQGSGTSTPAKATATAAPAPTQKDRPLLGNVTRKSEFLCKAGPAYGYNGKKYDLRDINDATAIALANDPRCMFIIWRDEQKRPQLQRIQNLDVYVS